LICLNQEDRLLAKRVVNLNLWRKLLDGVVQQLLAGQEVLTRWVRSPLTSSKAFAF
jgi:hypothetical protein